MIRSAILLSSLSILLMAGQASAQRAPRIPAKPQQLVPFRQMDRTLLCHDGSYSPFEVRWSTNDEVRGARGVFPHPYFGWRVCVSTSAGLMMSNDWGKKFQLLDATADMGQVKAVEFVPDSSDSFYVMSEKRGILVTRDSGKKFDPIVDKSSAQFTKTPQQLVVYGGDPSFSTLLACFGESQKGLAVSYDAGKTWSILYDDCFVHAIISYGPGIPRLLVVASKKDEPDIRSVYLIHGLGDKLQESGRDVPAICGAIGLLGGIDLPRAVYLATEDKGLVWLLESLDQYRHQPQKFLPLAGTPEASKFLTVGATYGPTADSEIVYAYDPAKLGLVTAQRDRRDLPVEHPDRRSEPTEPGKLAFTSHARGLYTGGFVKEGSTIRANADGSVFFGVINNSLYVGRRLQASLDVSEVTVDPPLCTFTSGLHSRAQAKVNQAVADFSKERQAARGAARTIEALSQYKAALSTDAITITARISGEQKPASVSVDLSRILPRPNSQETIMYDDGLHNDGAAGDGVYGVTVGLAPDSLRSNYADWRRALPGAVAMTVTAVPSGDSSARRFSGGVGILSVFARQESRACWRADVLRDWKEAQGLERLPSPDDSQPHPDKLFATSLIWSVKDKPWVLPLGDGSPDNFLGFWCLSFWIRTDSPGGKDLSVNLRDSMEDSLPTDGPKVSIVADGMVEGGLLDTTWRRVTIPIRRLIGGGMVPSSVSDIILSGPGGAEQNYWISDVTLFVSEKDWAAAKARGTGQ